MKLPWLTLPLVLLAGCGGGDEKASGPTTLETNEKQAIGNAVELIETYCEDLDEGFPGYLPLTEARKLQETTEESPDADVFGDTVEELHRHALLVAEHCDPDLAEVLRGD